MAWSRSRCRRVWPCERAVNGAAALGGTDGAGTDATLRRALKQERDATCATAPR